MFSTLLAVDSVFNRARTNLGKIGIKTGFGNAVSGNTGIYDRFALLVNVLLAIVGLVAFIYLFYSGFKWITAAGNEQEISAAKKGIRSAISGLVVIFLSYVIVNYVLTRLIAALAS